MSRDPDQQLREPRLPPRWFIRLFWAGHRAVCRLTGGRLGLWRPKPGRWGTMRLTTTGRRSGEPRSVMLTSPVQRGEEIVIVASRGGDDHHPAWFLNLQADPRVEVALAGAAKTPYLARVASAEERAELWPRVTGTYDGYAGYQRKTDREIPLVLLTPAA